jgi:recombination protein RecA
MKAAVLLSLKRLTDVPSRPQLRTFSTGIPEVDALTGIPRATLTEICGPASSGRTALVFSVLRCATNEGNFCAWIDTEDLFDPVSAANAGVKLSQFLWVRCGSDVESAVKATDLLIRAGGFAVVVVDLSGAPARITRRIPLTCWFRLRHGAEQSGAALLVIGDRVHASSCSRLQLELRQKQGIWSDKLLRGISAFVGLRRPNNMRSASFRIVR